MAIMNFRHSEKLLAFIILNSFSTASFGTDISGQGASRIVISPAPEESIDHNTFTGFTISVNPSIDGTISIDEENIWTNRLPSPYLTSNGTTIELTPVASPNEREYFLTLNCVLPEGKWTLNIPAGYFRIDPVMRNVEYLFADVDQLRRLQIFGAWHKNGVEWRGVPMFTIHDDDTIDKNIPSSGPSEWMKGGYFSTLFPVLESLGLKGCLSMEGWRVGFTDQQPQLNENGLTAKRLQDERGYEIQSHSMTARYQTNSWLVESLDSELADRILRESTNNGIRSNTTTSVYDLETCKSYYAGSDKKNWHETPQEWIKPYVGDYDNDEICIYNPSFPIDYQWGEWFRIAESLGIHGNAWVTPGPTASHTIIPLINAICPNGFESNGITFYNLPPLHSTVTRLMMEGQAAPGYKGERTSDNTFDRTQYEFFKRQIDEAAEKGAWIVMGMHTYRPCWVNRLPGSLVSEGGEYPDEWVEPMSSVDPVNGLLTPSPSLGISAWSEWHPCPGTRLAMLYDLLKYAKEKGMLNVTTSEAFAVFGNTEANGYYINGIQLGNDQGNGMLGTRQIYPHYIKGANGEESYYNYAVSEPVSLNYNAYNSIEGPYACHSNESGLLRAVSVDGTVRGVRSLSELPAGLWIVNGRKYLRH